MCIQFLLHNVIRMGSPDVPIRIPSGIVQVDIASVTVRTVPRVTADKGANSARKSQGAHHIPFYFIFSVIRHS